MTKILRNAAEIVSTTVLKPSCFATESCLEFKSTKQKAQSSYMVLVDGLLQNSCGMLAKSPVIW